MARELEGIRIACMATDGVEQIEMEEPVEALEGFGARVDLISIDSRPIQAFRHFDKSRTFGVDKTIAEVSADAYDALFLPGGALNADRLRTERGAVELVQDFFAQGKPVAAICHAPWILLEANEVAGRTLTSWPSLRTDIRNGGGRWVDKEVKVDGCLVTSRKPADLPAFIAKVIELFAGLPAEGRARDLYRSAKAADEVEAASRASFPASDSPSHW